MIIILSILLELLLFNKDQIEKCSESTGTNLVLYLSNFFLIKFHPQIIDLYLLLQFFCILNILSVGFKPSKPEIALITKSNLILLNFK